MQTFSPVTSNKLYIQIFNQIKDAIVAGDYKPGDRLPSEKDLCQMFNVSRVPVREALSALELSGFVSSYQGGGVYVKEVNVVSNDWVDIVEPRDIVVVRKLIEPKVAQMAAEHITPEGAEKMKDVMSRFCYAVENKETHAAIDKEFHCLIATLSGNYMFTVIYDMIYKATEQRIWNLILDKTLIDEKEEGRKTLLKEHSDIADAIIRGDPQGAYDAMKLHMDKLLFGVTEVKD